MKYAPHPYQDHAIAQAVTNPAQGLFLDMGLGKTSITLTALAELLDDFRVRRILVIAPLRVAAMVWTEEVKKWDHLRGLRLSRCLGSEKQRLAGLARDADIYIINRENVPWLVQQYEKRPWPFDTLVIDELSSFKNPGSRRFKALRKVRPYVQRVIGLTGTPSPNGLLDLWAQVYLLDGGQALGKRFTTYRDYYFLPDKRNREIIYTWKLRPGAEQQIQEKVAGLCLSMTAQDWLQLPERIDRIVGVTLPAAVQPFYDQMETELVAALRGEILAAGSVAVAMGKLLQVCNGAVYFEDGHVEELHAAKLDTLEELVEAANGRPVLVFYNFRHDITRIQERIPGARVLLTEKDVDDWNTGRVPVMLAHPASAGHGLNLQAGGSAIIWYGLPWSLELYQQANARLHRQGQTKPVIIHHLIVTDSIEETVLAALQSKGETQDKLIAAVKAKLEGKT